MELTFDWDDAKNVRNFAKHRIRFEYAAHVFDDPQAETGFPHVENNELRWKTYGQVGGVYLLVVHTIEEIGEETLIRLISARPLLPKERKDYEHRTLSP